MPTVLATNYPASPDLAGDRPFANILYMVFLVRSGVEILSAFRSSTGPTTGPPGKEWLPPIRRMCSAAAARPWSSLATRSGQPLGTGDRSPAWWGLACPPARGPENPNRLEALRQ